MQNTFTDVKSSRRGPNEFTVIYSGRQHCGCSKPRPRSREYVMAMQSMPTKPISSIFYMDSFKLFDWFCTEEPLHLKPRRPNSCLRIAFSLIRILELELLATLRSKPMWNDRAPSKLKSVCLIVCRWPQSPNKVQGCFWHLFLIQFLCSWHKYVATPWCKVEIATRETKVRLSWERKSIKKLYRCDSC